MAYLVLRNIWGKSPFFHFAKSEFVAWTYSTYSKHQKAFYSSIFFKIIMSIRTSFLCQLCPVNVFHLTPEYGPHIFEWTGSKCYKLLLFSEFFVMYLKSLWFQFVVWVLWKGKGFICVIPLGSGFCRCHGDNTLGVL